MARIEVKTDKCKGCSLCVEACPKKILTLDSGTFNPKGYNPCVCTDQSKCIGCAFCATTCPDALIEVYR